MKKQTLKKFYSFIPIIIGMFSASTSAQIVYTDVIPDSTFSCSSASCFITYNLDLNGDGIIDFTIHANHTRINPKSGNAFVSVNALGNNSIAFASNSYIAALSLNNNISSSTNWGTSSSGYLRRYYSQLSPPAMYNYGNWTTSADKYLGLKLIINGLTFYGWARLSVTVTSPSSASFKIKDYAYDATPNHSIHAGATSGARLAFADGNETAQNNSVFLFPNPASDKITLNISSPETRDAEIKIIDLMGKIIFSRSCILKDGNGNVEIGLADVNKGIYFLQIQSTEFSTTKKLIVTK